MYRSQAILHIKRKNLLRFSVHNVNFGHPFREAVIVFVSFILNSHKLFFGLLKVSGSGECDTEIPQKVIIRGKEAANRLQVHKNIVKLFQ